MQQQLLSCLASPHMQALFSQTLDSDPAEGSGLHPHELCRAPCGLSPLSSDHGTGGNPGYSRKSCATAELPWRGGKNVRNWRGSVFCKQKEVHFLYQLTIALCAKTRLELLKYLHLFLHLPNLFIEPSGKHWLFTYKILWSFSGLLHPQNSLKTPPPPEIVNYNQVSGIFCVCVYLKSIDKAVKTAVLMHKQVILHVLTLPCQ